MGIKTAVANCDSQSLIATFIRQSRQVMSNTIMWIWYRVRGGLGDQSLGFGTKLFGELDTKFFEGWSQCFPEGEDAPGGDSEENNKDD